MATSNDDPLSDVLGMLRGHWVSLTVRAAVELGVLESLVPGPRTMPDLAAETGTDPEAVARLVRVLVDLGLVEQVAGDHVALAKRGRLLTSQEPTRLDTMVMMRTVLPNLAAWQRLSDAVREGRSVFDEVNGSSLWAWLAANPEEGATFNAAMARRGPDQATAVLDAVDLDGVRTVVDVGGGRGAMLVALLAVVPDLRGIVADRPEVVEDAERQFAAAGLSDRAHGAPTDFMDAVPWGGDAYVLANVLHDWADDDCVRILSTVRSGMPVGARLLVVEQVLGLEGQSDEARRELDLLDLHMLVLFGARERTAEEYQALLAAAGFARGVVHVTTTPWQVIEATPA